MSAPVPTLPGQGGLPKVTARAADGACIEVYVHGAHVTSWHPAGSSEDRLYLSPQSHFAAGIPIRGGVPLCFPQFADQGPLPAHGFVRDTAWMPVSAGPAANGAAEVRMRLSDSAATRALWPCPFACELVATALGSRLTVSLSFTNTGSTPFDVTAALHSYLRVANVQRTVLEGLHGARYRDKRLRQDDLVQSAPAVSLVDPLDRVYHVVPATVVVREPARSLAIEASGSTDTVVWNPGPPGGPGPHDMPDDGYLSMLCVEAAIARAPLTLAPGATHRLAQTLTAGP